MNRIQDVLVAELNSLLSVAGERGGLMSPSVYDTAQVLRILSPDEGEGKMPAAQWRLSQEGDWPVVGWLLSQQYPDGGWGDPVMPLHRDIPTLAAVLALQRCNRRLETREAIKAGLHFLRRHATLWWKMNPDDLPVAGEILLPSLLASLRATDVEIPRQPYAKLTELGARKRRIIETLPMKAGVPWIHVWETWGSDPTPVLMDHYGSIGHSPSATAAWLKAAEGKPELKESVEKARAYLRDASLSTETGTLGLVPVGWPHTRFEQSFALYGLLVADLLEVPGLRSEVARVTAELAAAMKPAGIGMSDHYVEDGDDTSAVIAVMHQSGLPVDPALLYRFQKGDHFIAYPGEMHPSPTLTARCVHALLLLGKDVAPFQKFLLSRQEPDGRWSVDKWNRSWLYTTLHSVIALVGATHEQQVRAALEAVLLAQGQDGGWSSEGSSNMTETSYAVLMLGYLERNRVTHPDISPALHRAFEWMLRSYRPFARDMTVKCWISKELYRMDRVDTAFELSAMLMLARRTTKLPGS